MPASARTQCIESLNSYGNAHSEAVVERTLIGDSGLQDVGTNDYDSQAMRSCRKGVVVPDSGRGKKDPGFTEKNFGRLLIFLACCFLLNFQSQMRLRQPGSATRANLWPVRYPF